MKLFNKIAPAIVAATLIASLSPIAPQANAASTGIVIAEVFNASTDAQEWITIANLSTAPIDVTGWALQDYSSSGVAQAKWFFPSGTTIPAKKLLVIEKTAGNSSSAAQGIATLTGGNFNFAGASDRVEIYNASNALVDGVAWGTPNTVEGFSISGSSSSGTSFERKTVTDTDTAADWQAVTGASVQAYAWAPLPQTTSAPVVQSVTPADLAVNVATNAALSVTFDKALVKAAGSATILNKSNSTVLANVAIGSATLSNGNKTLTLPLPAGTTLQAGKKYEVTIPAGYVTDSTGVYGNGLKTWSFSTAPVQSANVAAVRSAAAGTIVSVRGEVSGVLGTNNVWIQDTTAGIRLYQASGVGTLAVGQEVIVTGTLNNYNNDLELDVSAVQVQSSNTITLPAPPVVAVNQVGSANAGSLVKVSNVWVKSDYTVGAGGIVVTDGTNDLIVYAQAGTSLKTYLQGLPKSSANKFSIVGVSSVFNTTIELFPRTNADITP
ncbi:hypothetical protein GK047_02375 [Paenibacillus sp. SYP-B3998]|uniref:LTD domain-containing protein n=1 Tax=Paenibacillus sp. SYP-B3998 TaxID=2678564 RepID=A0A6G3ZRW8_9BACL|nr:lamin tail domain-containing protein [Paenibacillus sp. SYP-B3998]NEW04865.1 hypothetical protein [Paenibacillus sp. SYP-B3998]